MRELGALGRHRFIFVGGLHRSGTSLLAKLLAQHPDIAGLRNTGAPEDEGQHLQDVYPSARVFGGPGRFGFAPEAHMTEHSPLLTPHTSERLVASWARFWDLSRTALLEKSPPNLIRTRFLQAAFPEAHFVMIARHPIAVAAATQKWSRSSPKELVEHWICCHRNFLLDAPHLQRILVVRYEDLVAHTNAILVALFRFLALPPIEAYRDITGGLNDAYFEWWKFHEDAQIVAQFDEEPMIHTFGYSMRQPRVMLPPGGALASILVRPA